MSILGIPNRTENWETARQLVPLLENERFLSAFAHELGESTETENSSLEIELFWKGMRDYRHFTQDSLNAKEFKQELVQKFREEFPDLREKVERFKRFQELKPHNYLADSPSRITKLKNNLINTEIDIVMQSPTKLYIGEAKTGEDFGSKSKYVFVHQLIRQYVMARTLLALMGNQRDVIPFVVGEDENIRRNGQVLFMQCQGWLRQESVFSWRDLDDIRSRSC